MSERVMPEIGVFLSSEEHDERALLQIGREQEGLFSSYAREIAPRLGL